MATLKETSEFVSPIYLIERTDPLMGSELGVDNKQAQQLACRTRYLLDHVLVEHTKEGRHHLTTKHVSSDAGIKESKLKLDHNTVDIYNGLFKEEEKLASILSAMRSIEDIDDSELAAVYRALMLTWKYGYPRFAFELFTGSFTFATGFKPVKVIETISGDDSIDVTDSSDIIEGDSYVIWDEDKNSCSTVTVKKVLTSKRVILYSDENKTRNGGLLTKIAWEIKDGAAIAKQGSSYITDKISLLDNYDRGNFLIAHYTDAKFSVEYRMVDIPDPTKWHPMPLIAHEYSDALKLWRSVYATPGGEFFVRVTCHDDVIIPHMALMSDIVSELNTTIRTPVIVDQDFTIVRFGAIYDAKHTGTYFQISENTDFINDVVTLAFDASDDPRPVWYFRDKIIEKYNIKVGQSVYWRARYTADDGHISRWSDVGYYTMENDNA